MIILFVCRSNVGRSQMAEAFFNRLSKENYAISSGVNNKEYDGKELKDCGEPIVQCMEELGYNLSHNVSKKLTPGMVNKADKIIVMADKADIPDYLRDSKKAIFWDVKDPRNMTYEFHLIIRDQIRDLAEKLAKEVG